MIPLLYSSKHTLHAPKYEQYHGNILNYPEVPARVPMILQHLTAKNLVTASEVTTPLPREALLPVIDGEMLTVFAEMGEQIDQILGSTAAIYEYDATHRYIYPMFFPIRPFMARLKESPRARFGAYTTDAELPLGAGTYEAALYSASVAYEGANQLLAGKAQTLYALCRPPGHHAGRDFMGGYCYLNNAAIAAARLLELGKVAIVDVDYHHGNGTQAIFWDEARVMFASLHGHPSFEYPYYCGYADETGAHGNIINKPLAVGTTAAQYLAALDEVLDRLTQFQPAALVISLGFDTWEEDPLSRFKISRATYTQMAQKFMTLNLPTLIVQEGGYQVQMLGELAEHFVQGCLP